MSLDFTGPDGHSWFLDLVQLRRPDSPEQPGDGPCVRALLIVPRHRTRQWALESIQVMIRQALEHETDIRIARPMEWDVPRMDELPHEMRDQVRAHFRRSTELGATVYVIRAWQPVERVE